MEKTMIVSRCGMRCRVALLVASGLLLSLLWLGSKSSVDIVRAGHLPAHGAVAVGKALESYRYFREVAWQETTAEGGKQYVVFTGVMDIKPAIDDFVAARRGEPRYERLVEMLGTTTAASVKITFAINGDKSIRVVEKESAVAITLAIQGSKEMVGTLRAEALQAIFENKNILVAQYHL